MDIGVPSSLVFLNQCASRERKVPDTAWLLASGAKVLTMQAGFGLVESSTCRKRNCANIMMKNIGDLVLAALFYQVLAYGLIYGDDIGGLGIIGDITAETTDYAGWYFHFSFAATAATIDSGALAERVNYFAYVVVSGWVASIVYPVTAHWVWNGDGWLAKLGFVDFAGSAVVHMLGAVSALCCVLVAGPRIGRFSKYRTWQSDCSRFFFHESRSSYYYRQPLGHEELRNFDPVVRSTNPVQMLFGTLVLWIGWYGFNGGSTLGMSGDRDMAAAKIFVTTTLGAAGGGFGAGLLSMYFKRHQERLIVQVQDLCNGILAGLVGVTAGAPFFKPSHATGIGIASGMVGIFTAKALERLQVDDVVGAISVHGVPGALGVIFVGLLAEPDCAFPKEAREDTGLFAPVGILHGGPFSFLATQCLGIFAIGIWGFFTTWLILTILHVIPHQVFDLRAERCNEIIGMDLSEHLFDDDISFHKECERDSIRAFESRVDVEHIFSGKDSPEKLRACTLIEANRVMDVLDRNAKESEKRDADEKLKRRMDRLERAFERRMYHVDACMKVMSENIQGLVNHVNGASGVDLAPVQFKPLPTAQQPQLASSNGSIDEFISLEQEAVNRIERWWHKLSGTIDVKFKLSVLETWDVRSHPSFHPDKEFENTAFRPKQAPPVTTDVHEVLRQRRETLSRQESTLSGQESNFDDHQDTVPTISPI